MGIPFLNKVKFSPMGLVYGNQAPPEGKSFLYHFSACAVLSLSVVLTLRPHGLLSTRHLCPWGFSRQEYWSGLSYPSPGDLPNPGIKPRSPTLQAGSLLSEPPGKLVAQFIPLLSHHLVAILLLSFSPSLNSCFVNEFISAYSPL